MALVFEALRAGGDNLSYIVGCSTERVVAVVDPTSAHSILDYCKAKNLKVLYVLNTHGHPDHTGGNEVIANSAGAKVLAHPEERIRNVSRGLAGGDTIEVGKTVIEVIHTPGHTPGGLCFKIGQKLITGDTMFLAGAGNTRFGGSVEQLFKSFDEKLSKFPDRTTIHPGHDYAEVNLRFARTIEPDNQSVDQKLKETLDAFKADTIVKSSMGEERKYSPFMRYREEELIESLRSEYPELSPDDPFQVFKLIRELRNGW